MRAPTPILLAALLAGCAAPRTVTAPLDGVLDARTGRVVSFEAMIEDLASVPMVYVGESHTNPEHHEIQRRVIDALSARNANLMVGMEMLQRPYQEVLDRWTAGGMDEGAFVRESSWFDQWGWGWWTKSAILRLARDRRLRMIGLNVEFGIMAEIGRKGLADLRNDFRASIPADIDLGVKTHEKAIRAVFPSHPGMQTTEERFRRFYEAQCTMDETMAETAVLALRDAPKGSAMVVLAGGMHVKDFHAIPERARRRNGLDYRVVLPLDRDGVSEEDPVKIGMGRPADYVIFTAPTPEEGKPKIGLALRGGDALVKQVVAGGAAAGAGMQAEDVLLSIDGKPVADLVGMKILLEDYSVGSRVLLRWRRGEAEMEGTATLQAPPPMFR